MKTLGGIVAWLGGMAMLIGGLFFLLSLKNTADLSIWMGVGMLLGFVGLSMTLVGWALYQRGKYQEEQERNQSFS